MKGIIRKTFLTSLAILLCFSLASCKKKKKPNTNNNNTVYYDNEKDILAFSSQSVDGVFNPFFSTAAADSNVIGLTQIGMISNDKEGKPCWGDGEAVITKDFTTVTNGTGDDQTTTYYFVLKNNVRFSNGSYLTIKDVLFNFYVYLDPVYTGSSTIYSTDIVGLKEYRTQASTETEQDNFKAQFELIAGARINALVELADEIQEDFWTLTKEEFREELEARKNESGNSSYEHVVEDYDKALEFFRQELKSDFNNSKDSYNELKFTDKQGNVYENLITTDVEMFLMNEGYLKWNKGNESTKGYLESSFTNTPEELKNTSVWTEEYAINKVFADIIPNRVSEVVSYWVTATKLFDYIVNQELEKYYSDSSARTYKNISGIVFENKDKAVTVNGKEYKVPTYKDSSRNQVTEGNEVLSITIKGVDPKAIWNFSLGIAPMYYYSDAQRINKFDYEENFGVEYASQDFMENVVNHPDKIGVPMGAGPYAASKSSGGITNIKSSDFNQNNIIHFERNPYYIMGPAKIKKIHYQITSANQMLNALYNNEIDFVEPNAKPEIIKELDSKKTQGIENKSITTSGYGYIGINAGKVPTLAVRQVIMHTIDTQECVNYYQDQATPIYRSMSTASWAYPEHATAYYPYLEGKIPTFPVENYPGEKINPAYKEFVESKGYTAGQTLSKQDQKQFIKEQVEAAGYKLNASDIYVNSKINHTLKYTFTIAGEETDHPAWQALFHSAEILNENGFDIIVTTDANALKKLSTGDLTVWAAAWGSTIDPDMYQVYHKESKATSVNNWGYKQILQNTAGRYDTEVGLIDQLSEIIEAARKIDDTTTRKVLYGQALDIVMQLAIELPTYQRKDLYAFNGNKIDVSSLNQDTSPYKGLTSDIHTVSLNTEK